MRHINESKIPKCSTNNDTMKCKKCITYYLFLTWTSQSFSPICDWLVTKNLHRQLDTLPEESNPVSSHWKKYKHSVEHILEIIYNDHFFFLYLQYLFTVTVLHRRLLSTSRLIHLLAWVAQFRVAPIALRI